MAEPTRKPLSDRAVEETVDSLWGEKLSVRKAPEDKVKITLTLETYRSGYEQRLKFALKAFQRQHGFRCASIDKVE